MGYEKIHHTAPLLVCYDRNVPSRYRHAIFCVCGAPQFLPASMSNAYSSPRMCLQCRDFFFFPGRSGQSDARGLRGRSTRVPGSHSDTLIQSDLSVIYKVSLGSRAAWGPAGQKVTGLSFIGRNQTGQKAPKKKKKKKKEGDVTVTAERERERRTTSEAMKRERRMSLNVVLSPVKKHITPVSTGSSIYNSAGSYHFI